MDCQTTLILSRFNKICLLLPERERERDQAFALVHEVAVALATYGFLLNAPESPLAQDWNSIQERETTSIICTGLIDVKHNLHAVDAYGTGIRRSQDTVSPHC